jgi:hypothetical protein
MVKVALVASKTMYFREVEGLGAYRDFVSLIGTAASPSRNSRHVAGAFPSRRQQALSVLHLYPSHSGRQINELSAVARWS